MGTKFVSIIFEKKEGVAKIILNRPEKLNPVNEETLVEIREALRDIEEDDAIKVVVIAAKGKYFSAGGDLEEIKERLQQPGGLRKLIELFRGVMEVIENFPKPVVGAAHGNALAGGLELLQVCDIVIASENARFADQHANFGFIPSGGGSQRLPRLIGIRKAKELILTGDSISAEEAARLGLVNKVVPSDKFEEAVDEMCKKLKVKSPSASRGIKILLNRGTQVDLISALQMEQSVVCEHSRSSDFAEGMNAFEEKRKPQFSGR